MDTKPTAITMYNAIMRAVDTADQMFIQLHYPMERKRQSLVQENVSSRAQSNHSELLVLFRKDSPTV